MMKIKMAVFTASVILLGSVIYLMSAPTAGNDFHVGPDGTDIELYSTALRPCTNAGLSLGTSALQFNSLYIDGTATMDTVVADEKMRYTSAVKTVNYGDSVITPTTPFTILTSTVAVSIKTAATAVISTLTATTGDYLILTSTSVTNISLATGSAHYLIAPTSPTIISQNDVYQFVFNGTYWLFVSSATQ